MNEPLKPHLCIPQGYAGFSELVINAAIREVQEETNLTVEPKDLELLLVANGSDATRNVTFFSFYYVCREFAGTPEVVSDEVSHTQWVPITDLLSKDFTLWGKPFSPVDKAVLAKHRDLKGIPMQVAFNLHAYDLKTQ